MNDNRLRSTPRRLSPKRKGVWASCRRAQAPACFKCTQGSGWTRSPVPFDRGVSITLRVVAQRSRLLLHPRTRRLCKLQAVPAWGISRRLRDARCVRSSRVCHRRISTPSSRPVFSLVASTYSVKSSVDAARGPTRECVQGQLAGKQEHTSVCVSIQRAHSCAWLSISRDFGRPSVTKHHAARRPWERRPSAMRTPRCCSHSAMASRISGR